MSFTPSSAQWLLISIVFSCLLGAIFVILLRSMKAHFVRSRIRYDVRIKRHRFKKYYAKGQVTNAELDLQSGPGIGTTWDVVIPLGSGVPQKHFVTTAN